MLEIKTEWNADLPDYHDLKDREDHGDLRPIFIGANSAGAIKK